ncbi:response regulator [Oxalobacteraceae bacterium]|nr:response regulator [Oxalobacteraceae bacterium]
MTGQFTTLLSRSLFWKLFAPICLLLLASAFAAMLLLPYVIQRSAERDAIEAGQDTVRQFNLLRRYYTENVVNKVLSHGKLKVSFDHLGQPDTVPLPATMILDLSTMLREYGTSLKLYSPYPFPNRRERQLDQFGRDAWTFLQTNPDQTFSRVETVDGKTVVRVAQADRMTAQTCVNCHNSLPESPRKNWKLGDVRGVLEVDSSRQLATGQAIINQVLAGLALMLLLLAGFIRLFYQRSIAAPLELALATARTLTQASLEKVHVVEAIADGRLEQEAALAPAAVIDMEAIPRDEVGQLLRSVVSMSEVQIALDHAIRKMTASLRAGRDADQARDWLKSGLNELNVLMRGEQDSAMLADTLLSYLAGRTGAAVGALFLYEEANRNLALAAGYALPQGAALAMRVAVGEGLMGQAVRERRILLLEQVPPAYFPAGSALGRADPGSLMLVPLLHGGSVVGAIELGAFRVFSALEQELMEACREALAIGFEVNLARQRTKMLLLETEQQAEELRVQQEELQQTNGELEERTELLECQREQLRTKHAEMARANEEIWRKAEQLQQVSAYKSEFLANMSHELRTPLNSMLILSGLLKENKRANLDEKQVDYARTIHSAGKDLLALINDILDLSKVEAGQFEFRYEMVETAQLCASMQALFQQAAEQSRIGLRVESDAAVPAMICTDGQRAEQILKNLISNAIKFTASGEVVLRLSLVEAGGSAAGPNPLGKPALALAVSDTGIGVADDKRELIFEAFKQADGSVSRRYGGTGLGLSISLQLARGMGGALTLHSVEGQGSTFTLYLPLDHVPGVRPGERAEEGAGSPPQTGAAGRSAALPGPPPAPAAMTAAPAARTAAAAPGLAAAPSAAGAVVIAPPALAPPLLPPAAVPDDRASLQPGQRSILIIEDDRAFAGILLDMVRQRGFAAIVALDGESGLALAQHYLPSAVLLDVMLPHIDGWGVMRSLKDGADTRHIPVHFITCLEERQRALEMGAVGFVTKPVGTEQMEQVFAALEQALQRTARQLLIVEDDANEALSLVALLSERNVELTVASSGAEAIALLEAGHFDCMVLDLGLADMSGEALLDHMQGMEQARRIPVIIHSGRDLNHAQERALQRHAESIIIKGARSPERLLNEVTLFLHMVESQLEPERQQMIRTAIDREAMLEGRRVLIVDDDMRNLFSLTSLLSERGMAVLEAENGQEALNQLQLHPDISVVLMDIMMPQMDGYEAMRRIRADSRFASLPIIAMTAKAMQGDHQKCLEAGASDYLAKPIDNGRLMSLLRVWCSR